MLKTNDGCIASSLKGLKIEQKIGAWHHIVLIDLLRSSKIMEQNRLYLACPGP